jgi:hypothetical protein
VKVLTKLGNSILEMRTPVLGDVFLVDTTLPMFGKFACILGGSHVED